MSERITFDWIKRPDGTSEFMDFMNSLPLKSRAKLAGTIKDVEDYGFETAKRQQWVKKLTNGIFELRSKQGSDIQRALYFQEYKNHYIITHGFTKKTDRTPNQEIDRAQRKMTDYLRGQSQ